MAKLIIKNVSNKTTTHNIEHLCSQYGSVKNVRRNGGEIHVRMQSSKQAKKAHKALNNLSLSGNRLEATLQ